MRIDAGRSSPLQVVSEWLVEQAPQDEVRQERLRQLCGWDCPQTQTSSRLTERRSRKAALRRAELEAAADTDRRRLATDAQERQVLRRAKRDELVERRRLRIAQMRESGAADDRGSPLVRTQCRSRLASLFAPLRKSGRACPLQLRRGSPLRQRRADCGAGAPDLAVLQPGVPATRCGGVASAMLRLPALPKQLPHRRGSKAAPEQSAPLPKLSAVGRVLSSPEPTPPLEQGSPPQGARVR
eukprot:TRINITY_DN1384_c1_g1_i1.p2 TRINITY_DN1384_c1_g1~~TRINITY_DN1384_c1_g1_i1.p2  ORF type:complete len:256 (+),score=95.53 TRINITY_DN1384_c1_g1_i1:48-770(+)